MCCPGQWQRSGRDSEQSQLLLKENVHTFFVKGHFNLNLGVDLANNMNFDNWRGSEIILARSGEYTVIIL